MNYIESVLQPGERIIHHGRIHWITNVSGLITLIIGLGVLIDSFGPNVVRLGATAERFAAYALIAAGIFLFLRSKYVQWTTEIAVTDRRIIQKSGFIARNTAEMNINQVERVEVSQSILGRILNYGTVRIHGSGQGLEGLADVADPLALRTCITAR
jgi:uncharacterized membrane protein YdbT with pleckstrin-like domain